LKVVYEESYPAQYGPHARVEDAWLMVLPCANGHIGPWDETRLAAYAIRGHARAIRTLPFVELWQEGSDGFTVLFPVERFEEVARIMRPRRRRVLSPEAKKRLAQRVAKYRFRPAVRARFEARVCVPEPLDDVLAVPVAIDAPESVENGADARQRRA